MPQPYLVVVVVVVVMVQGWSANSKSKPLSIWAELSSAVAPRLQQQV